MFKYAQEKTSELWGGTRGDMLVTLITLIAAYLRHHSIGLVCKRNFILEVRFL